MVILFFLVLFSSSVFCHELVYNRSKLDFHRVIGGGKFTMECAGNETSWRVFDQYIRYSRPFNDIVESYPSYVPEINRGKTYGNKFVIEQTHPGNSGYYVCDTDSMYANARIEFHPNLETTEPNRTVEVIIGSTFFIGHIRTTEYEPELFFLPEKSPKNSTEYLIELDTDTRLSKQVQGKLVEYNLINVRPSDSGLYYYSTRCNLELTGDAICAHIRPYIIKVNVVTSTFRRLSANNMLKLENWAFA